jgi:AcrR family transcriptional regulator
MLDLRSQTPKGQRARTRILSAAEELLVTRGFHGTSVRDIAKSAGLPLATVVYHFARKEQLYAAVLNAIAGELEQKLADVRDADQLVVALARWTAAQPRRVVLLMRELLDNPPRVARASQFPLAGFLARSAELLAPVSRAPELAVLQVVGAASYVVAAWPTIERIIGRPRARALAGQREAELIAFARRALDLERDSDATDAAASTRSAPTRTPRQPHHRRRAGPDVRTRRRVRR